MYMFIYIFLYVRRNMANYFLHVSSYARMRVESIVFFGVIAYATCESVCVCCAEKLFACERARYHQDKIHVFPLTQSDDDDVAGMACRFSVGWVLWFWFGGGGGDGDGGSGSGDEFLRR